MPTTVCPGCYAEIEDLDGPTHRYIDASPACWDIYSRLLAGDPPIGPGWLDHTIGLLCRVSAIYGARYLR